MGGGSWVNEFGMSDVPNDPGSPRTKASDPQPPACRRQFTLRHVMLLMLWLCGLLAAATQVTHHLAFFVVFWWLGLTWVAVCYRRRSANSPAVLPGVCMLLLGAFSGYGGLMGWILESNAEPPVVQIPFEVEAWKRADPIDGFRTVRIQMIDDVQKRYNFSGWTRDEVTDLLGKPDWMPPAMRQNWQMAYLLGRERSSFMALDNEFLVFRFDLQGNVISYLVTTD